jgi:hypothetical protein
MGPESNIPETVEVLASVWWEIWELFQALEF